MTLSADKETTINFTVSFFLFIIFEAFESTNIFLFHSEIIIQSEVKHLQHQALNNMIFAEAFLIKYMEQNRKTINVRVNSTVILERSSVMKRKGDGTEPKEHYRIMGRTEEIFDKTECM